MKLEILKQFKKSFGKYLSGEEISNVLNVTRAAIWKHIATLRDEGYVIESSSGKGYKLISVPDVLYADEIKSELQTRLIGQNIEYYNTVDSTNILAGKLAFNDCPEGTVVIAEKQETGRGRRGRKWHSPSSKGIWMSIVLRPDIMPEQAPFITIIAALSIYLSLEQKYNLKVGIKWPNDIVFDNKKLCGILTEMNAEPERVYHIIVGIGNNAYFNHNDFPSDLKNIATSIRILRGHEIQRRELITSVLSNFEALYYNAFKDEKRNELIELYKNKSITLGNNVKAIYNGETIEGKAIDITNSGELLIEKHGGKTKKILSGEVEHCR